MKYLNIYKSVSKVTCSALLSAGVLTASFSAQAASVVEPSQKPLSLTVGVPPNVLVTLDDSGSMAADYAPDEINGSNSEAMRSNAYNSMFYDPTVNYVVPKKYVYENSVIVGKDSYSTEYPKAKTNGFNSSSGTQNLTNDSYYYNYVVTSSCPASPVKDDGDCYEKVNISTSERQNFANWFSFYRTRQLATQSSAILAFSTMPDNVRLTWGALNTCDIGSGTTEGTCNNNKMDAFANTHRENFFKWLEVLPASGGTPLHKAMHRAGEFIKSETSDTSVCRANYHVLMTDGKWNNRNNSKGDADSTQKTLPDGTVYTGSKAPYSDSTSGTLADTAFYYWANDLRDLPNKIAPYMPIKNTNPADDYWDPRNNPATWQHMVNFTVGLGLSNSLTKDSDNGTQNAPTWNGAVANPTFANIEELKKLGTNSLSWPEVVSNKPSTIYDLWHAAINSRGEFFSADSPDTLVTAFKNILERISGRSTTGSSPAINSGVGDDGVGYAFQASYDASKNWAGNLIATQKSLDTSGDLTTSVIWNAADELNTRTEKRNIKMVKDGALKDFIWGNLSTIQKGYLNRNPDKADAKDEAGKELGATRLEFLQGVRTNEGKTLEKSTFRTRNTVLGDIVNSKPVTVRGARYLTGLANRIEGTSSNYEAFVTAQSTRTPMVYVGANDGMLHGFNANTGDETFAFVPTAVFPNLHELTGTSYSGETKHRFFVDGSPVVADVYLGDTGWRTVLVGTLGAGGKGMFALDVTDPAAITLLWEFNEDKLADKGAKLGYTFSQPTIARLHNGKWAAVVGNGYSAEGSDSGKASLLIIDIATGALTKDLVVQGATGVVNGMSTPKLADLNGDGIADFAYAGDMQGNVWRFDLAPGSGEVNNPFKPTGAAVTFQTSFGGKPLFSAKDGVDITANRQPITAAPSIVRHPTGKGYIIVVGTGRYHIEADKSGVGGTQSIYGILDTTTKVARSTADSFAAAYPATLTRDSLQSQTMNSALTAVDNLKAARELSNNEVNWSSKAGWYFDLVLPKEMIVADMLSFGQTLYFQSLVPNADPCAAGVDNWSYAINPATGGRTKYHAWTDYRIKTSPNTIIAAVKMGGEGGLSIGQRADKRYELCTGAVCNEITPDPASIGRQSWRVVGGQ